MMKGAEVAGLSVSVPRVCGRFVSSSPPDELARYFDVDQVTDRVLEPSWNVAPTDQALVVLHRQGARHLQDCRWGLLPFWAAEAKVGNRFINARSESLATSNAFKPAFERRRCIVPANGFYEWRKSPASQARQPYFIHRPDGEPFAFAGLWEAWRPPPVDAEPAGPGERIYTFTIITGPPNEAIAPVHDRMPSILPREAWDSWLDPSIGDLDLLGRLLVPAPSEQTVMHPVSPAVNGPRTDGPELALAVELPAGRDGPDAAGSSPPPGTPVQGTLL